MAVDAFVEALNDRELKIVKVLEREPSSLDQAYKIAERMELYQNIPDERVAESKPKSRLTNSQGSCDCLRRRFNVEVSRRDAASDTEAVSVAHRIGLIKIIFERRPEGRVRGQ